MQNDVRVAQAMTKKIKDCCNPYETKKETRQKRRLFRKKEKLKVRPRQYTSKFQLLKSSSEGYIEPLYFFYHQKASQGPLANIGQPAFDANTYGFAAGWNYLINKNFLLQIGSGYTHSSIYWERSLGHGKWDTFYFGPLFGWSNRKYFANVMLLSSYNFYDVKRRIQFSSVNYKAKYKNPSFDLLLRGTGGTIFKLATHCYVELEGQLDFLTILAPATDERNAGPLSLHIYKTKTFYAETNFKMRLIRDFYSLFYCFSPNIYVGWVGNIPIGSSKITSRFVGEQTAVSNFQTQGYRQMSNQLMLGIEFVMRRYDSFRLSSGFEWNTLSRYQIYQANLKLEWSF